jgi:CRP-like cAMP-binding protein
VFGAEVSCAKLKAGMAMIAAVAVSVWKVFMKTQYQLADALGLSAVHVNRVLRELRDTGLVTFRDGHVTIQDYKALANLADFDPTYLDHNGPILV